MRIVTATNRNTINQSKNPYFQYFSPFPDSSSTIGSFNDVICLYASYLYFIELENMDILCFSHNLEWCFAIYLPIFSCQKDTINAAVKIAHINKNIPTKRMAIHLLPFPKLSTSQLIMKHSPINELFSTFSIQCNDRIIYYLSVTVKFITCNRLARYFVYNVEGKHKESK